MARKTISRAATIAVGLALIGCGSDGTSGPTGPANGGGAGQSDAGGAGQSGAGGAAGGIGSGGSTGQAGGASGAGGGTSTAGQCSPGVSYPEASGWNAKLRLCDRYDAAANGLVPDPTLTVQQIILPEPMIAGQSYGLSVLVTFSTAGQTIEFWGTSGTCGHADEKLLAKPLQEGELCADFNPTSAHESILMAWRGDGSITVGDITVCAHGKCP